MIPLFPEFRKLDISLSDEFDAISKKFEPYAEFSFPCLFCWDINDTGAVSLLNGNLVIKMPDYISSRPFYSLLGTNEIDKTIGLLLSNVSSLQLVPEVVTKKITSNQRYVVVEDRDQFDYIYSLEDQAHLPGKSLKGRRKNSRKFYGHYEKNLQLQKINFKNVQEQEQIMNVFEAWGVEKGYAHKDLEHERKALNKILVHASELKQMGVRVMINGGCVGFSIYDVIDEAYSVCRFQKTIPSYPYMDAFLSSLVAKELLHFGCKYISWEQDLGIEGLRQFKESYKPLKFLKKYSVKFT